MTRYAPSAQVVARRLDDTIVLASLRTNRMFELEGPGARLWELAVLGLDDDAIVARVQVEFDVDEPRARHEIAALMRELVTEGLLVEAPSITSTSPSTPEAVPREPSDGWVLAWDRRGDAPPFLVCADGVDQRSAPSGTTAFVSGVLVEDQGGGRSRRVRSPAEAVLACLERGAPLASALRGAFAAAVHDRARRRLLLTRDATGVRPLFWAEVGDRVLVSSSADAILAQPGVPRRPNRALLSEYLMDRATAPQLRETWYEAVWRVPPGHEVEIGPSALESRQTWDPLPDGFAWASGEEEGTLASLVERAVDRCVAAGSDALSLSGGLDSVTIAFIATRLRSEPLRALALRFRGTAIDESAVQRAVAARLGMPLSEREVSPRGASFTDDALAGSGTSFGPIPGMWQTAFLPLLREARAAGCRSVLFGTGGDELFTVDTDWARDLLRRGELRKLASFTRAWLASSPLPAARVTRMILWSSALKPELRAALGGATALEPLWRHVRPQLRAGAPARPTLAPTDARLAAILEERRAEPRAWDERGDGHYRAALRSIHSSPVWHAELDAAAAWLDQQGLRPAYPYLDPDLFALALRLRPEALFRGGRMKGPLRALLAREAPGLELPSRKVDFTDAGREIFRRGVSQTWRRRRGLARLRELGLVDPRACGPFIEAFARADHRHWAEVWRLLATEEWLAQGDWS